MLGDWKWGCLKFEFDYRDSCTCDHQSIQLFCLLRRGVLVLCFFTSPKWGAHGLLAKPIRVLYHV
jgi:hypothetical protein